MSATGTQRPAGHCQQKQAAAALKKALLHERRENQKLLPRMRQPRGVDGGVG